MQILTLLDGVAATGPGPVVPIDHQRCARGGPIPMILTGITTATVVLEGAIATEDEVRDSSAVFEAIEKS